MGYKLTIFNQLIVAVCVTSVVLFGFVSSANEDFNEEYVNELLKWEAPYEIQKNYPYYLSGFDDEGSPVWIFEYGHWDVRGAIEKGPESEKIFDKYVEQMIVRFWESLKIYSTEERKAEDFILIDDLKGFDQRQFSHVPTVAKVLGLFRKFIAIENKLGRKMKAGFGINLNFLATSVWGLSRPVLGDLTERIDVYGTNEDKWKNVLLKIIPRHALPPWYGGYSNHTVVKVYG